MPLLEVKNLKVHFPVKAGMFSRVREFVKAVDDVSFSIAPGETPGFPFAAMNNLAQIRA
jgi:ABC-type oligopeptide transport system ATPase subunit